MMHEPREQSGQHVTAMGSDAEHKNDPVAIARADVYVADSLAQTRRLGELHHAIVAHKVGAHTDFPELGQIIAGMKQGRSSDREITIADLTGTGVQDTAIATLAFARACASDDGRRNPSNRPIERRIRTVERALSHVSVLQSHCSLQQGS